MQVWAVVYDPALFSEDLYQRGLRLVDPESAARIKRFYRREDACRTLLGRLLTRALLRQREIPLDAMTFNATAEGKPYISTSGIDPPIAYNISHDNALVAMAFAPGTHNPPAYSVGMDVMKVRIPGRETFASFVETVGDQLTRLEHQSLFSSISQDEGLKRFFWMWTIKEAYTKALGLGLGFDFRRVEYDVEANVLRVDKAIPHGWRFSRFVLNDGEDLYQGVVAEFVGGTETAVIPESASQEWLISYGAVEFVEKTIGDFEGKRMHAEV
ncbi:L-aminoadipate-semialdehyde dehydrogenase-phosphopantetheinyl transferase [Hypsizygus marmoreus]|uniref:holo-[acyl-carrier-protein] synthase n=1 Tax=Hypsizygus marmoreus TaxID=39966 RepID=A0A369JM49_HYPMA|nr:L-aminoadipate-semialdehyde dehydrogenase-phosphopantetheinyl transferase [Hypsizygus marmoreus]